MHHQIFVLLDTLLIWPKVLDIPLPQPDLNAAVWKFKRPTGPSCTIFGVGTALMHLTFKGILNAANLGER